MHSGKDVRGMYPSLDFAGQLVTACVCACTHVWGFARWSILKRYNKANIVTSLRKDNYHIMGRLVFAVSSFMQILCKQRFMTCGQLWLFQNWINTVFRYTWWCRYKCVLVFQPQKLFQCFWKEAVSWGWEWALKCVLAWPWVCSTVVHTLGSRRLIDKVISSFCSRHCKHSV